MRHILIIWYSKMYDYRKPCTQMFPALLFTVPWSGNNPTFFTRWLNKQLWYSHTRECYSAIKRKILFVPYRKGITLSEISWFLSYILYNPIYITFWKRPNYSNREHISGCQRLGCNYKGQHKVFFVFRFFFFWRARTVCLDFCGDYTYLYIVKTHRTMLYSMSI